MDDSTKDTPFLYCLLHIIARLGGCSPSWDTALRCLFLLIFLCSNVSPHRAFLVCILEEGQSFRSNTEPLHSYYLVSSPGSLVYLLCVLAGRNRLLVWLPQDGFALAYVGGRGSRPARSWRGKKTQRGKKKEGENGSSQGEPVAVFGKHPGRENQEIDPLTIFILCLSF